MQQKESSPPRPAAAPKAAAISGIVFSVLLIISFVLFLTSTPAILQDGETWTLAHSNTIVLGLNLVPFAGIAFLWFMAVVRDRLGTADDRFIGTVFLGSGMLFLAMLFILAAVEASIILLYVNQTDPLLASSYYNFGRTLTHEIMNTYALKMAGVFMISTSTLFIRSRVIPRWLALLGYALAAIMLLRIGHLDRLGWVSLSFPLWVLLVSISILISNYRRQSQPLPPRF